MNQASQWQSLGNTDAEFIEVNELSRSCPLRGRKMLKSFWRRELETHWSERLSPDAARAVSIWGSSVPLAPRPTTHRQWQNVSRPGNVGAADEMVDVAMSGLVQPCPRAQVETTNDLLMDCIHQLRCQFTCHCSLATRSTHRVLFRALTKRHLSLPQDRMNS